MALQTATQAPPYKLEMERERESERPLQISKIKTQNFDYSIVNIS